MGEHPSGQKRWAYLLPLSRFYEVLFQKRWMQKLAERPSSNTDMFMLMMSVMMSVMAHVTMVTCYNGYNVTMVMMFLQPCRHTLGCLDHHPVH